MVAAEQLDRQQAMEVARLENHADQARISGEDDQPGRTVRLEGRPERG